MADRTLIALFVLLGGALNACRVPQEGTSISFPEETVPIPLVVNTFIDVELST